jgi:hypothetical protein
MIKGYLESCVYYQGVFDGRFKKLPGLCVAECLEKSGLTENIEVIEAKLYQSCMKMCIMWAAGDKAIQAHDSFYSRTIQDSPALFGEDAVEVYYHLEAMVLIARSALDIASGLFGHIFPDPFPRKRFDSFNTLMKVVGKNPDLSVNLSWLIESRNDKYSWLSFVADNLKGRSIRDKIAHQTQFPIDHEELRENSEKESPIVWLDDNIFITLQEFVDRLRLGVVKGFIEMEQFSLNSFEINAEESNCLFKYDVP